MYISPVDDKGMVVAKQGMVTQFTAIPEYK